ncbi:hypothetical protein OROHE_021289 [Orobanche hederae]
MSMNGYYVVWVGKQPGIYTTWSECESQVKNVKGAKYKKYASLKEAEVAIEKPPPFSPWTKSPFSPHVHPEKFRGGLSSSDLVKVTVEDANKKITLEGSAETVSKMMKDLKI